MEIQSTNAFAALSEKLAGKPNYSDAPRVRRTYHECPGPDCNKSNHENTVHYLLNKDQYLHNKKAWQMYLEKGTPGNPEYHLLHLLMTGRNVFAGFGPLTSAKKIENRLVHQGRDKFSKLRSAIYACQSELAKVEKLQLDPEKYKGWYRDSSPDRIALRYFAFDEKYISFVNNVPKIRPYGEFKSDVFLYLTPELTQDLIGRLNNLLAEINK